MNKSKKQTREAARLEYLDRGRDKAKKLREQRESNLKEIHLNHIATGSSKIVEDAVKKANKLSSSYKGLEGTKAKTFANENKRTPTPAEVRFINLLDKLRVRYVFEHAIQTKVSYILVDFYLPKYGIVVEVDGPYHDSPEQKAKDYSRDRFLCDRGHSVIRLTNKQVFDIDSEKSLGKLLGLYR